MLASEVPFRSLEQPEHPISSSKIIAPNLDTYIQLGTNICHVTSPPSIPFCVPLVRATVFLFRADRSLVSFDFLQRHHDPSRLPSLFHRRQLELDLSATDESCHDTIHRTSCNIRACPSHPVLTSSNARFWPSCACAAATARKQYATVTGRRSRRHPYPTAALLDPIAASRFPLRRRQLNPVSLPRRGQAAWRDAGSQRTGRAGAQGQGALTGSPNMELRWASDGMQL